MARQGRRRGFTLVELLVVIGIIAVLISILLPALSRAKDQANRIACMNNQKQLVAACLIYAQEGKGFLPNPNDDGTPIWRGPGWLYDMGRGAAPIPKQEEVRYSAIWPMIRTFKVYHCPAEAGPFNRGPAHPLTSYLMNWAVGAYGMSGFVTKTKPALKLTRMPPDAVIFWEGDETSTNVHMYSDGTNEPVNGITRRHGSGASVSRFDGGVVWMTRKEFDLEAAKRPGRLWCNPEAKDGHRQPR